MIKWIYNNKINILVASLINDKKKIIYKILMLCKNNNINIVNKIYLICLLYKYNLNNLG